MKTNSHVLIILTILFGLWYAKVEVEARFTTTEQEGSFKEEQIFISPKCAAVLISGGALGVVLALHMH
jgi:hypothetical protein